MRGGKQTVYIVYHTYLSHTAEANSKIRTLERASKNLKSEKALLQEQIAALRDQVTDKDRDLRGVKGELREIQDEHSRLMEKLLETKAEKKKFSRLAREKAEEMGKGEGGKKGVRERERDRETER